MSIPTKAAMIVAALLLSTAANAQTTGTSVDLLGPTMCYFPPSIVPHDGIGCVVYEPANWHLLTQSYGGTVSLLHGLTKRVCEETRSRMTGVSTGTITLTPGTIIRAECFQ